MKPFNGPFLFFVVQRLQLAQARWGAECIESGIGERRGATLWSDKINWDRLISGVGWWRHCAMAFSADDVIRRDGGGDSTYESESVTTTRFRFSGDALRMPNVASSNPYPHNHPKTTLPTRNPATQLPSPPCPCSHSSRDCSNVTSVQ